jgi:hypothetical protein
LNIQRNFHAYSHRTKSLFALNIVNLPIISLPPWKQSLMSYLHLSSNVLYCDYIVVAFMSAHSKYVGCTTRLHG